MPKSNGYKPIDFPMRNRGQRLLLGNGLLNELWKDKIGLRVCVSGKYLSLFIYLYIFIYNKIHKYIIWLYNLTDLQDKVYLTAWWVLTPVIPPYCGYELKGHLSKICQSSKSQEIKLFLCGTVVGWETGKSIDLAWSRHGFESLRTQDFFPHKNPVSLQQI